MPGFPRSSLRFRMAGFPPVRLQRSAIRQGLLIACEPRAWSEEPLAVLNRPSPYLSSCAAQGFVRCANRRLLGGIEVEAPLLSLDELRYECCSTHPMGRTGSYCSAQNGRSSCPESLTKRRLGFKRTQSSKGRKEAQAPAGAKAMADYEAASRAIIERTARLKALGRAKEATQARSQAAPASSIKKRRLSPPR